MNFKHDKQKEALQHMIAEFVERAASPKSLITVNDLELSSSGEDATVYISVLPENLEQEAVDFLNRQTRDISDFARTKVKIQRLPRFNFKLL